MGVAVGKTNPSLNERATVQNIDPLVDSEKYLGKQSNFLLSKIVISEKPIDKIVLKEEDTARKILSAIANKRYLHRKNKINSIKNIELSNPNSNTRRVIKEDVLDLAKIPPQIRNMATEGFRANEYTIVKLNGFERNSEGKINLSAPKYEEVTEEDMVLGGILIKAVEYENPELGILKDNYSGTIYDNLTYVRRRDVI